MPLPEAKRGKVREFGTGGVVSFNEQETRFHLIEAVLMFKG